MVKAVLLILVIYTNGGVETLGAKMDSMADCEGKKAEFQRHVLMYNSDPQVAAEDRIASLGMACTEVKPASLLKVSL